MVRDLMIDIPERELLFEDKSSDTEPVFDSVWGNLFDADSDIDALICNVVIPEAYWSMAKYDDENELTVRFTSVYKPIQSNFKIRLVGLKDGKYSLFSDIRGDYGSNVSSYALDKNMASRIMACQLPFIDMDGEFRVRMVKSEYSELFDKAYIYSAKSSDIDIDFSDNQAAQLLSLCAPGKSYRYPTTGVGITSYLNSVVSHTDLENVLENQFSLDKKPIQSADFDNSTGELETIYSPEEAVEDTGLSEVGIGFFTLFTDEYVRKNVVLNEVSDTDFISMLADYDHILALIMFTDDSTTKTRIANSVVEGKFDADGNIVSSDDHFIVTATLEANTIIMFDDEEEDDVKGAPIFIVNDTDQTRLYTSLVEQPYWLTETCHKCMVLMKRFTIRYMIGRGQWLTESKGLYTIPQTSANIKNMCALVQDNITGGLMCLVSSQTNVSEMVLDEITQYIYASKTNE